MPNEKHFKGRCFRPCMEASPLSEDEAVLLEQGRQDFDNGRFWHAHEAWEDLWNSLKARHAPQAEILLVQGLIQTAALLYNHQRRKVRVSPINGRNWRRNLNHGTLLGVLISHNMS